jgi:biopolymer transport protein ExbD
MAEIQQPSSTYQKRGGIRSKKLSTKVDLTPMVDLGFLLITFFIFTTTIGQAKAMKLVMPTDEPATNPNTASRDKTLQIVLGDNNKVAYYYGDDLTSGGITDFSSTGLRSIIQQKKKMMRERFGTDTSLALLIKPTAKSSYQNFIDAMDEVQINALKIYVLMDADEKDKKLIAEKNL